MRPILFELFGHRFQSYFVLLYFGFIVGSVYYFLRQRRLLAISPVMLYFYIFVMFISMEIGGGLLFELYRLFNGQSFRWHLLLQFKGLRAFHSAVVTTVLVSAVFYKTFRWKFWPSMDSFTFMIILTSGISRIGCLLLGCCFGEVTDVPWAIPRVSDGQLGHPTQIYSFIMEMSIASYLIYRDQLRKVEYSGQLVVHFGILYSIYRFIIEFFRESLEFVIGLTHAQVFSLACIPLFLLLARKLKSADKPALVTVPPKKKKKR
jgi:phosphatidylglycerol:prolipoprotein diacylglycerol transferase